MGHEWVFWLIVGPVAVLLFTILGVAMWHLRSDEAYEKLMRPRDKRPS
jgi:membrane protein required for beta-lactamase induction